MIPYKMVSSGWQDSNLRPPRPKRGAITGLRYTPIWLSIAIKNCGENGTRTHATLTRRQISNLLRYHSGTSPIVFKNMHFENADANVPFHT